MVQHFIKCSLAPSTQNTYTSAKKRYTQFCQQLNVSPLPVSENVLCHYVAHLAQEGLKHTSIKTYLSAIRHAQILAGQGDPFQTPFPLLEYVLRGIKGEQVRSGKSTTRTRLPITPEILLQLRAVWEQAPRDANNIMLWAACTMCFFGFLRVGEIAVPSSQSYDAGAHLSVGDVTLDNREQPSLVQVTIKASKTDPFRKGVVIFMGTTQNRLCPVAAISAYLAVRGSSPGPFFTFKEGTPLSRELFVARVRSALTVAGIQASQFAGHSFRIGAASTAAARGVEDSLIKTLGRWRSSAYLLYVRIPRERLADLSRVLAS